MRVVVVLVVVVVGLAVVVEVVGDVALVWLAIVDDVVAVVAAGSGPELPQPVNSGALSTTKRAVAPRITLRVLPRRPPARAHLYVLAGKLLAGPVERVTDWSGWTTGITRR